MNRSVVGVGLAVVIVGCGDDPRSDDSSVVTVIDTVSGVVHVRNSGSPSHWTAEPVLRLGTLEDGPEAFGRVRSVIADGDGNVYVADNLAHQVRVFARDGRHVRDIGRPGGGPGEFGDLYSLAWLDGKLAAMDPRNARIALLSPMGDWIDGIQHFPITGPASLIRLHPLGESGFYAPGIDPGRQTIAFVRHTSSGPSDTILSPQAPPGAEAFGVLCHQPDGGITSITVPGGPSTVYGFPVSGGSVAVSWSAAYQVAIMSNTGDTMRVVTRDTDPIPYPDEAWEEAVRPYRELRAEFPGARCQPASLQRPRYRAALRHIMFDESERMWIEAASADGFHWEIFDREGRLVGTVAVPPRQPGVPPYVRSDHLYQVETDDMDVQYVVAYRISAADRLTSGSLP